MSVQNPSSPQKGKTRGPVPLERPRKSDVKTQAAGVGAQGWGPGCQRVETGCEQRGGREKQGGSQQRQPPVTVCSDHGKRAWAVWESSHPAPCQASPAHLAPRLRVGGLRARDGDSVLTRAPRSTGRPGIQWYKQK